MFPRRGYWPDPATSDSAVRTIGVVTSTITSNICTVTVVHTYDAAVGDWVSTRGLSTNTAIPVQVTAVTPTTLAFPLSGSDGANGSGTIVLHQAPNRITRGAVGYAASVPPNNTYPPGSLVLNSSPTTALWGWIARNDGSWLPLDNEGTGGGGGGGLWTQVGSDIHYSSGAVAINGANWRRPNGLTINGADIDIISSDGRYFRVQNTSVPNNPVFAWGNPYTAGIGLPALMLKYWDDIEGQETSGRLIFSMEKSGTVASVGDGQPRPGYEAYVQDGDVKPWVRIINRDAITGVEFGDSANPNAEVDVGFFRNGVKQGILATGDPAVEAYTPSVTFNDSFVESNKPHRITQLEMQTGGLTDIGGQLNKRVKALPAGVSVRDTGSIRFDGTNYLEVQDGLLFGSYNDFTFTCWHKVSDLTARRNDGLVAQSANPPQRGFQLFFHPAADDRMLLNWSVDGETFQPGITLIDPGLNSTSWIFIAVRKTGTSFEIRTGSGPWVAATVDPTIFDTTVPVRFGAGLTVNVAHAGTLMDHITYADSALSDTDVDTLYGAGTPPLLMPSAVDLWYRFNSFAGGVTPIVPLVGTTPDYDATPTGVGLLPDADAPDQGVVETSPIYALGTDTVLAADASADPQFVDLPQASATGAQEFIITKTDASTNAVTVRPFAGDLIGGQQNLALLSPGDSALVINTGGGWITPFLRRRRERAHMVREVIVVNSPDDSFVTVADASWFATPGVLRGFSLTNGVLAKTSPGTRSFNITCEGNLQSTHNGVVRFGIRRNGTGVENESLNDVGLDHVGSRKPFTTRTLKLDLAQGDTLELVTVQFGTNADLTFNYVTVSVSEDE